MDRSAKLPYRPVMENALVLVIDYETPLRADGLGELLSAMARDYGDLTPGRTLVIAKVEDGSIIVTLTDLALTVAPYVQGAVGAIAAVNAIAKFARLVKSILGKGETAKPSERLYKKGRKKPGIRSAEALLKIAAESGAKVRLKRKTAAGEMLEFEITPIEAIAIRERATSEAPTPQLQGETTIATSPRLVQWKDLEIKSVLDKAIERGDKGHTDSELQQIAETIFAVIGAGYILDQIISNLDKRKLHRLASKLRDLARRSEPPLQLT